MSRIVRHLGVLAAGWILQGCGSSAAATGPTESPLPTPSTSSSASGGMDQPVERGLPGQLQEPPKVSGASSGSQYHVPEDCVDICAKGMNCDLPRLKEAGDCEKFCAGNANVMPEYACLSLQPGCDEVEKCVKEQGGGDRQK